MDYQNIIAENKNILTKYCLQGKIELVFPAENDDELDKKLNEETDKYKKGILIRNANKQLIQQCDAVIANLENFRGLEPDVGTCFEIGYAQGLGKDVVVFSMHSNYKLTTLYNGTFDYQSNTTVEDFNMPFNLMLAPDNISEISNCFENAFTLLAKKHGFLLI